MGKISKKYIGDDQVGSVQLELENALSLRAKSQDGLSSVDLLEYNASDVLVVQQDLHMLATKNIISDTALGSAFNIQTSLGADIIVEPGAASSSSAGGITYIRGGDSDTGVAGAIFIQSGEDSLGVKSSITLDAFNVQCSAMQFKDAADPTDEQDLATKSYVDAQISAGTSCDKQIITLSAGDISAQYVDLNEQFVPESLFVGVGQRVNLYETLDYTLSIVGGVTRLTFAGPSATAGAEALVDGDILYIQGIIDLSP